MPDDYALHRIAASLARVADGAGSADLRYLLNGRDDGAELDRWPLALLRLRMAGQASVASVADELARRMATLVDGLLAWESRPMPTPGWPARDVDGLPDPPGVERLRGHAEHVAEREALAVEARELAATIRTVASSPAGEAAADVPAVVHAADVWGGLSDPQRDVLRALHKMGAFDMSTRQKADNIAARIAGRPWGDGATVKGASADLAKRGLTASKTGAGGGSWLTTDGRALVEACAVNADPTDS